jgi:4-amino-4-deoxy-L-arabinose transferase-like glycosyltransferase
MGPMPGGFQVAAPAAPEGIATRTGSTTWLCSVPWAVCAITVVAAALRLAGLDSVAPNPFYDAAVRSMSLSLHNFFFGAFDPGSLLSIDKPPIDLWLQVFSVKLFGWGAFALKLPEALAGILAVPMLYDAVRRAVGPPVGLAAAAVLALAPQSVLTARSDTMDSVMMLLVIAALWLVIRAVTSPDRRRFIVFAGVALGLAFNVKLLESVIAVPALVVLYVLASQAPWRRKLTDLALAGAAFVGVGLSWAIVASLAPGSHPWPVGSSDGTVFNAIFVFNGSGRVSSAGGPSTGGPGLLRLLDKSGWHFDVLFGCVLMAALVIGLAGVLSSLRRTRSAEGRAQVLPRAFSISVAVWITVAMLVFDTIGTMHTRYLEALSPAVAIAIGYGAVTLAGLYEWRGRHGMPALAPIVIALACIAAYFAGLKPASLAGASFALVISAIGSVRLVRLGGRLGGAARWLTAGLIIASAMVFPVHESLQLVRRHANDSGGLAAARPRETTALSTFLRPRTAGVRYELAVDEPTALAPLIIRDQRPILPLTSFGGRPLIGLALLRAAIASGQVRYGLVANRPCGRTTSTHAYCTPAALWIRRHGVDVSKDAGLRGRIRLYRLT